MNLHYYNITMEPVRELFKNKRFPGNFCEFQNTNLDEK